MKKLIRIAVMYGGALMLVQGYGGGAPSAINSYYRPKKPLGAPKKIKKKNHTSFVLGFSDCCGIRNR